MRSSVSALMVEEGRERERAAKTRVSRYRGRPSERTTRLEERESNEHALFVHAESKGCHVLRKSQLRASDNNTLIGSVHAICSPGFCSRNRTYMCVIHTSARWTRARATGAFSRFAFLITFIDKSGLDSSRLPFRVKTSTVPLVPFFIRCFD